MALARHAVLHANRESGVPLPRAAAAAAVPLRTAQRWLAHDRQAGLAALAPTARRDRGQRRFPAELAALIEVTALRRPAPSIAHVHRQTSTIAMARGWPVPSYGTVRAIVGAIDPGMATLAHDGPVRYRERFELVYRREASRPNDQWQADHTQLELLSSSMWWASRRGRG